MPTASDEPVSAHIWYGNATYVTMLPRKETDCAA